MPFEREVELLTADARRILLALALVDGPASITELAMTAGISEDATGDGLGELGRLFLVPQPRLFDDQERYTLNRNTRSLVVEVFGKTQAAKQIQAAIGYLWGQGVPLRNDRDVGSFCRQAVLLVREGRHADAEELLTTALAGDYPEDPRLLGQLAWVYRRWNPPRVADARQHYRRSAELGNSSPDTFWHWAAMERDAGEFHEALRIAELGLQRYGADHGGLLLVAALARERQAADLSAAFLEDRGLGLLEVAEECLRRAVACSDLRVRPQELSKTYGSLVRVLRKLGRIEVIDSVLDEWAARLPEDLYLKNERSSRERLGR
jgi:tetratricopeptide (TPR) repeat protein